MTDPKQYTGYVARVWEDIPRMTDTDWIVVTVRASGYRKPVRRSAILSYGTLLGGVTFIDIAGKTIEVSESETEIARLVGSPFVGGVDTAAHLVGSPFVGGVDICPEAPPPPPPQKEVSFRRGS